jgi:hypothetical protein
MIKRPAARSRPSGGGVLSLGRCEFDDCVGQHVTPPFHRVVFLTLEHHEVGFGSDSRSAPIDCLAYGDAVSSPINSKVGIVTDFIRLASNRYADSARI